MICLTYSAGKTRLEQKGEGFQEVCAKVVRLSFDKEHSGLGELGLHFTHGVYPKSFSYRKMCATMSDRNEIKEG